MTGLATMRKPVIPKRTECRSQLRRSYNLLAPIQLANPVSRPIASGCSRSRYWQAANARNIRNIVLMRPINSMIEFKQIIGRGTRLYDGKDYFTIYDFVKAYRHFSDPEWDGEPLEPEPCETCGSHPCQCVKTPPQPCSSCGKRPCECPKEPCETCRQRPCVCKRRAKVSLADGKARTIQHMVCTTFWHPDGTPMSALQFMEMLFGRLPEFFKDEDELRSLWSAPDTRKKLLQGLAEKGFGHE